MMAPRPVFSEDGLTVGVVETSPDRSNRRLLITHEPFRTQIRGLLADYALAPVFGDDGYLLYFDEKDGALAAWARSLVEDDRFVPIARLEESFLTNTADLSDDGPLVFSLRRIHPDYTKPAQRHWRPHPEQTGRAARHHLDHLPADAPILVSACLLGEPCRYDGQSKAMAAVCRLAHRFRLHPVCPEVAGGLATPRPPAERQGRRVRTQAGQDVTAAYKAGADYTCRLARESGATLAILKAKSPSCGVGKIYSGAFNRRLKAGDGMTAEALLKQGLFLLTEEDLL